ncbi:putative nuclease HARBI1 isoform X3 [Plodia interpunctella]|uniref:putative nuclease HARBI1 isoform X3 n=1 Tax=Plodia interpunctella TaxID=58824 RepID=UPI003101447B
MDKLMLYYLSRRRRRRIAKKRRQPVSPFVESRLLCGEFVVKFGILRKNERFFFKYFKVSLQVYDELYSKLEPYLKTNNLRLKSTSIVSPMERFAMTLRFYEKFSIPGVIGCIDGTHVAILRPAENERYFNRKHFHSRNVLIICDSDLNILSVDASFGGASHDSFIWNQHPIKDHLTQLINAGESAYLLGDSGYAQREYMMTPIVDAAAGSPEEHYTKMHVTARNTVEHTIGVLKNRWRCLLGHRVLHYHPVVAAKNINACCVLHNMCNRAHLIMEDDENPNNINRPSDAEPALQERAGASIELQSFYRVTIYIDLKYKDTSIIFN